MLLPLALLAYLSTGNAYLWPSPQLDALESVRWDQEGHNRHIIAPLSQPCDVNDNDLVSRVEGVADTADWLRTASILVLSPGSLRELIWLLQAFHDMAPHNVEDGTGGLDASIRFQEELSRPQNAGPSFALTISTLMPETNRYVSIADVLAVATIIGIEGCGGPEIAFRGGRVDAMKPNALGVPNTDDSLKSFHSTFSRLGFTPAEMIGLVACGHTLGGIEHGDDFDTTQDHFDNNIATEYISGTTLNPLVVGPNATTNSDKRIFESDGNKTMRGFAESPQVFSSTCGSLLARMLDTVPRGVQLTQVITPLPVKPSGLDLVLDGDVLKFSGEVRFWNMTADADVRLLWDDHTGGSHNFLLSASGVSSAVGGRYKAAWWTFNSIQDNTPYLSLSPAAGITNMRFTVDNKVMDQGGVGFAVHDSVVFSASSCVASQNPFRARFDVAVRKGVNPTRVYLVQEVGESTAEPQRPKLVETDLLCPDDLADKKTAYAIWSINLIDQFAAYNVEAEVNGLKIVWSVKRTVSNLSPCAP
ncbi:putative L-ascorbate oxidase [Mycena rebaudengoi]|nr:putative L-ascorbate oxidase [Mycena rebaudengoi]